METETNVIKTDPINLGAKGYYSLNVYKEDGSEVVEKRIKDSQNVVTYDGAYRLFFGGRMFSSMYANIGTGTTELTRTSPGLGNRFSASSNGVGAARSGNEVDNGDGTSTLTLTRTMTFALGSTPGTFSEVGISLGSDGSGFIAGQLIKDEFGTPTTITVLSDEQLRVTYTLELTVPNGGQDAPLIGTGSVTTPEGVSSYSVYAQPFFAEYAVGSSIVVTRHNNIDGRAFVSSAPNSGATYFDAGGTDSISHDGAGTVTRLTADGTASPSSFSNTSIRYHLTGYASSSGVDYQIGVNETSLLTPSNSSSEIAAVIEFNPPLSKDSTRSYKCRIETVYNI